MIFTVAIDGPAASGKGTVARAVAARFGFAHLDTGLLYRAVGRATLEGADAVAAARALDPDDLGDPGGLRGAEVAAAASRVAAIPEVRAALVDFQRRFARRAGGAVVDGRDICSVICPEAEVQLYVTADPRIRAERRHAELSAKGDPRDFEAVLEDVLARDARDMGRADAPLTKADRAVELDTSRMSVEEAVGAAVAIVGSALPAS
ncbi:(d)CMP kinase [Jannaschia sp. Os4]|uniref:(d)CMP kinase n=1 Tax=Jannaschia sp. Os4 TaxID=2807617 RepID=UPI00193AAD3C|nr:(d)CMP kinase [Jannaschia sp. Os4]MBM2577949.1 (d)CMP kinase [Jannaschia sp. Os4]